ncbi:MAG: hypothetical protein H6752_14750 [Candidatus Omnitrophica bacterium]|nr:hypothetical protein [Candidatus Omnitrophota bacterium]
MIADRVESASDQGEFFLTDVYEGVDHAVERGTVKYLRVVEEVKDELEQLSNGAYRNDHEPFMNFYVSPVDLVSGPAGWPTYVAKARSESFQSKKMARAFLCPRRKGFVLRNPG